MLSLIVAMDENQLVGRNNALPWHLPSDLGFFKRTTMGKPVVMGRNTYESIGKPLPGRQNVVISRRSEYEAPGCTVLPGLEEAIRYCGDAEEIVVIGGAQVYAQTVPLAERMYITRVQAKLEGDAWFTEVDWSQWQKVESEEVPADEKNRYAHCFELWERVT